MEIGRALHGERDYAADVMQLLYIANRYEHRPQIELWLEQGLIVICDRYLASSIAYGEAFGLDPEWLTTIQRYLPQPSLTIVLDIPPAASPERKQLARDRYEQDLALLDRVRASYRRQAAQPGLATRRRAPSQGRGHGTGISRGPLASRAAVRSHVDHAARTGAGLQRVQGVVDLIERIASRDQFLELQSAVLILRDESRNVASWLA